MQSALRSSGANDEVCEFISEGEAGKAVHAMLQAGRDEASEAAQVST